MNFNKLLIVLISFTLFTISQLLFAEPDFLIMKRENLAPKFDYQLKTAFFVEHIHLEEDDENEKRFKQEIEASFYLFGEKLKFEQELGMYYGGISDDKKGQVAPKTEIKSKLRFWEIFKFSPSAEYKHAFEDKPAEYELRAPLEIAPRMQFGALTIKPFIEFGPTWDYVDEEGTSGPLSMPSLFGVTSGDKFDSSSVDEGEYIWGHREDIGLSFIIQTRMKTYLSIWSQFHSKKQPRQLENETTGAIHYYDRTENKTENHLELIVKATKSLTLRNEFTHIQDGYWERVPRTSKNNKKGNYENIFKVVYSFY